MKGMTFTLVVLVLLFVIVFIVSLVFLIVGKDYLSSSINGIPDLIGVGKK